jgi:hypothetical protein
MNTTSKAKEIEKHLKTGRSISGLQAIAMYRVYRLSSVIHKLRKKGYKIKTTMIENEEGIKYASYALHW